MYNFIHNYIRRYLKEHINMHYHMFPYNYYIYLIQNHNHVLYFKQIIRMFVSIICSHLIHIKDIKNMWLYIRIFLDYWKIINKIDRI